MTAFDDSWRTWTEALHLRVPGAETRYAPPADPEAFRQLENQLTGTLDTQVQALYALHNGEADQGTPGTFLGLKFLSLQDSMRVLKEFRDIRASGIVTDDEDPDPRVRVGFPHPGHLPVFTDTTGNYLGVDADPGPQGQVGQVLLFGADFDTPRVVFDDLAALLNWAAALLVSGRVMLRPGGRWPELLLTGAAEHPAEALLDRA